MEIPANHVDGDLELLAVIYAVEEFSFHLVVSMLTMSNFSLKYRREGRLGFLNCPRFQSIIVLIIKSP